MNARRTRGIVVQQLRQTEVEYLRLAFVVDHYIAGFDVAMNYSLRMGHCQRIRHLNGDRQSTFKLQRLSTDELPHIATRNVLHRNKVDAIDFVEVEDGADVWMV